ncbi:TadE family type IV pilus minor pilin [Pseudonocardia sp. NPDC046786]|uniref:TadE family type IV pilus minor pilin n=1 Tax=Pseudonocardia sp. NPDC046786 TaxID=3155471 RepID=UPI0033F8FDDE
MRCRRRSDPHGDAGAVTVEAALALAALVLVTAAAVAAVAAVGASVRCADAARELVRQAARGDVERGRAAVAALAPSGAESELRIGGDTVVASVRARPVRLLPVTVGASAVAVLEPGASGAGGPGGAAGDGPSGAGFPSGARPTGPVGTR